MVRNIIEGSTISNNLNPSTQDAAAFGNTTWCSSGDNGSSDIRPQSGGLSDNLTHAHFPAFSTYFLARVRYHDCRTGGERMIRNHANLLYYCPHEWLYNEENMRIWSVIISVLSRADILTSIQLLIITPVNLL
jgi:hypothetical protein